MTETQVRKIVQDELRKALAAMMSPEAENPSGAYFTPNWPIVDAVSKQAADSIVKETA